MKLASWLFILGVIALVAWFPYQSLADRYSFHTRTVTQSLFTASSSADGLDVPAFLQSQPGPLKQYDVDEQSAATIIENNSLYYGLSPRLHLALLETVNQLLSDANAPESALQRPFGDAGPDGFAAQIEWASRELRAGLGPYERPPVLSFSDGVTITLTLDQVPEGVAVQRFLAHGRSSTEWHQLVERFGQVFQDYFHNELPDMSVPPEPFTGSGFLEAPWPLGSRVVHLAFFDHMYPTVDSGPDNYGSVVTYLGQGHVQYNSHDGHDYFFPDQPIGTPILAAASGIAYARTHRGNGVVILHPNGYETVYWHLDAFAPMFDGRVDRNEGIRVAAGEVIGTSGDTGFVQGSPHLHFEVRRYGRQVDPYGWYGPGPDPCSAYAGCEASTWLWHASLRGLYDFTPPDETALPYAVPDESPPTATLSINPPEDLLFLARFDGHVLQEVGNGFPASEATLSFDTGKIGEGVVLPPGSGLTYPISDNLRLEAGTISIWAHLPQRYPRNTIRRHYLFAASANAADSNDIYTGTLALRRDMLGPGDSPRWDFWTTPQSGADERHDLAVPDTLAPGWHHFAVTWDADAGRKTLYLDGEPAAAAEDVVLPVDLGPVLQIGRFTDGGSQSGMRFDELAIFGRALSDDEVQQLAATADTVSNDTITLTDPAILIDTNAIDAEGGIVAIQLGIDGVFEDPQPYYDRFRWQLPLAGGEHTLAVRYFDRAGNRTEITRTINLKRSLKQLYLPLLVGPGSDLDRD